MIKLKQELEKIPGYTISPTYLGKIVNFDESKEPLSEFLAKMQQEQKTFEKILTRQGEFENIKAPKKSLPNIHNQKSRKGFLPSTINHKNPLKIGKFH